MDRNRKRTLILLIVSAIVWAAGYLLTNSYEYGLCYRDFETNTIDVSCGKLLRMLGSPLYYGFGALSIVFLALVAYPQAFSAWKKFAMWFIPFAILVFIIWSQERSVGLDVAPRSEQVFQWVSGLYVLISLAIVGRVLLRGKKN